MEIEGTYTLQAAPEEVWKCLMDQQTLQDTIPGIQRLEALGEHTHAFTLHIRHAPLKGSYSGQVRVIEQDYPSSYRLTVEGEGQQGKINGEWRVHLSSLNANTVVAYKGTLHPGKLSTLLPAPMVKGTIKVLIEQFFTTLADQLRTSGRTSISTLEDIGGLVEIEEASNGHDPVISAAEQPTFLHRVVRQLGLGSGDPVVEDQWVTRLRRISAVSILLLLVWIGTRLPRKLLAHD